MPLFMGASLYKEIESREGEISLQNLLPVLVQTGKSAIDPLLEMSFMEGLQSVIKAGGSKGELTDVAATIATGYLGQFVPAMSGQIARIVDDVKRSTYAPTDSPYTKTGESFGRSVRSKVPGLSTYNEASINVWGRERKQEGGNIGERVLLNMVSPGSYASNKRTALDEELGALYERTGENSVIPKNAEKYFVYDGQTYYTTAKEYTAYQKEYGGKNLQDLSTLIRTDTYRDMTDGEKAEAVALVYEQNNYLAKQKFLAKRGISYSTNEGEKRKEDLAEAGSWAKYLSVKNAFDSGSWESKKERKALCDRIGVEYSTFTEVNQKREEITEANKERYSEENYGKKASGLKTKANRYHTAEMLAQMNLTNKQRQALWAQYYKGAKSQTYEEVAKERGVWRRD